MKLTDEQIARADALTRTMRDLRRAMMAHPRAFTLFTNPGTPAATGVACTVQGEPSLFLVKLLGPCGLPLGQCSDIWSLEVFGDLNEWETNRPPRQFESFSASHSEFTTRVINAIIDYCDIEF